MLLFALKNFSKGMSAVSLYPQKITEDEIKSLELELKYRYPESKTSKVNSLFVEMYAGSIFMFLYMISLMIGMLFLIDTYDELRLSLSYLSASSLFLFKDRIYNYFKSRTDKILKEYSNGKI